MPPQKPVHSEMPDHKPTEEVTEEPQAEVSDQLTYWREKCADHVEKLKAVLEECNDRVNSRSNTEETCHQEMMDYVHHLDECAMPKAFAQLK